MLTKNFYCALASDMFVASPTPTMFPSIRTLAGAAPSMINYLYNAVGYIMTKKVLNSATPVSDGIIIGTGNEPPTLDDYAFSGDIITAFTYSVSQSISTDASGAEITNLLTITNAGSADFTIGEIGIVGNPSSSGSSRSILFERTVLDEPVTIPAGGVGQVTYTIRMDYPTE